MLSVNTLLTLKVCSHTNHAGSGFPRTSIPFIRKSESIESVRSGRGRFELQFVDPLDTLLKTIQDHALNYFESANRSNSRHFNVSDSHSGENCIIAK